jgi:hypothetical protein
MSNFDRKAGPPGGPGDVAAAAAPAPAPVSSGLFEEDAGPAGGPGDYESIVEEAEEES